MSDIAESMELTPSLAIKQAGTRCDKALAIVHATVTRYEAGSGTPSSCAKRLPDRTDRGLGAVRTLDLWHNHMKWVILMW
jgi:hypothetical protein